MRIKRKFILILIIASNLLSNFYIFASQELDSIKNESITETTDETSVVLSTTLTGGDGSFSKRFDIPSDMGFFKLWLYNTCGTRITYTVTKGSGSDETKIGPYTLEDGEQATKFGYRMSDEPNTLYVNVTYSDGRELSGQVGVRVATTYTELQ